MKTVVAFQAKSGQLCDKASDDMQIDLKEDFQQFMDELHLRSNICQNDNYKQFLWEALVEGRKHGSNVYSPMRLRTFRRKIAEFKQRRKDLLFQRRLEQEEA